MIKPIVPNRKMEARYSVSLWISISVCIAQHSNKLLSIAAIKFQRFRPQPSSGGAIAKATAKVKNSKLTTLKSSFVSLKSFCKAIYLRNRKNWHCHGLNEKFLQDVGRTPMRRDQERQSINLLNLKAIV